MKPNTKTATVDSTLTGEDVAMGLDARATAHIMSVLTDLYSDPERAILREYATNALDAHREAGVTRPIEVELPTSLRPTLVIRDFGVGLDAEAIRDIYSQYGASTKRGTNDATGMLGLGCKSALTYTDQFSINAAKDGVRTTVSVSRAPDGGGTMKLLAQDSTTDGNGVEIVIPAQRGNELRDKADELFRFWPEGSVLVNDKAPTRISGVPVGDNIQAWHRHRNCPILSDVIVMGHVPYPTDFDLPHGIRAAAWVEIGALDFAPSREALQDTAVTRATLQRVKDDFRREARATVQRQIDAATTRADALAAYDEARFLSDDDALTWQGEAIPAAFKYDRGDRIECTSQLTTIQRPYGTHQSRCTATVSVGIREAASAVWFTGWTNVKFTKPQRVKINAYLKAHGFAADRPEPDEPATGCILTRRPEVPCKAWVDPAKVIEWADVRKWRDPATAKPSGGGAGPGAYAGTYPTYVMEPGRTYNYNTQSYTATDKEPTLKDDKPATELDPKAPLFYWIGSKWEGRRPCQRLADAYGTKVQLVVIPETRKAKFLRAFPSAKSTRDALADAATKWWAKVPAHHKTLLATPFAHHDLAKTLDPAKMDDPVLSAYFKAHRRADRLRDGLTAAWQRNGCPSDGAAKVPCNVSDYPLLVELEERTPGHRLKRMADEIYLYINAAYAARNDNG